MSWYTNTFELGGRMSPAVDVVLTDRRLWLSRSPGLPSLHRVGAQVP